MKKENNVDNLNEKLINILRGMYFLLDINDLAKSTEKNVTKYYHILNIIKSITPYIIEKNKSNIYMLITGFVIDKELYNLFASAEIDKDILLNTNDGIDYYKVTKFELSDDLIYLFNTIGCKAKIDVSLMSCRSVDSFYNVTVKLDWTGNAKSFWYKNNEG